MTPEEKARVKIDQWFADAGWKVANRDEYEPTISAVAIREGLLKGILKQIISCLSMGKLSVCSKLNEKKLIFLPIL